MEAAPAALLGRLDARRLGWAGGAAVCALSGAALAVPSEAARRWLDPYRGVWWALFLFGAAALVVFGVAALGPPLADKWRQLDDRARRRKEAKEALDRRGPEERALLRHFARQKRRALVLPSRDPVVRRLARACVLLGADGLASEIVDRCEYRVASDDLWDQLLADEEAGGHPAPER